MKENYLTLKRIFSIIGGTLLAIGLNIAYIRLNPSLFGPTTLTGPEGAPVHISVNTIIGFSSIFVLIVIAFIIGLHYCIWSENKKDARRTIEM